MTAWLTVPLCGAPTILNRESPTLKGSANPAFEVPELLWSLPFLVLVANFPWIL